MFNKITVMPQLPERIRGLSIIANNLWWSWNTEFLKLFKKLKKFKSVLFGDQNLLNSFTIVLIRTDNTEKVFVELEFFDWNEVHKEETIAITIIHFFLL